ncbi:MAG TPA: glycoside hydrolase family 140 protein [Woeseiaceae bacterium]|nr:glycoside hydrolase family 140 protein [Woeseiaceae bacterium]
MTDTLKRLPAVLLSLVLPLSAGAQAPPLAVAADGRSLEAGGDPFFWLGDTGWLMLSRLDRAETEYYLRTRREQGFNVIQAMVLHTPQMATAAGAPALTDGDPARPRVTPGSDPDESDEYDYWDHLDWVVSLAAELGMYLALVPCWGTVADAGALNADNAEAYGRFLGERYRGKPNIVWLNGGDTLGASNTETWSILGRTLKHYDPDRLMTFHPYGRTDSSWWFHDAPWLDFNMFQSGHASYAQDPDGRGEDNWSYAQEDWAREPAKPVIDGEPSYENIPHGLHYAEAPRWTAADVRRYAWWAALSGAAGHTYGENSVMQMFVPGRHEPAFHAAIPWKEALESPGAGQMRYLKDFMLSRPADGRRPAPAAVVDNGEGHERIPVLQGDGYMIAYVYTGRPFRLRLGQLQGSAVTARWYSPRDGHFTDVGLRDNAGIASFDPPGAEAPGNDWVLLLETSAEPALTN